MITRLAAGDATVGQLAASYPVSLQAVSKHLEVREDAGLVSCLIGFIGRDPAWRAEG